MSDQHTPQQPDEVLGHLAHGEADSGLHASQPASHRKAAQPAEPLARPRGALVAMRKSGGLRFTWRLIVVHRDGRLIYKSNELGAPEGARVIGTLDAARMAELQQAIDHTDFAARSFGARQNPDAFAYEIIARVGRKNRYAEAFEGSIPAALKPLIGLLSALLPAPPEIDAEADKPDAEDE